MTTTKLYRVYTKGDGYLQPIKRWFFLAAFVYLEDAEEYVSILRNNVQPNEDIFYKIMRNGKNIMTTIEEMKKLTDGDDPRLLKIMEYFDAMEVEKSYEKREQITWKAYKVVTELNDELKASRTFVPEPIEVMEKMAAALKLAGNWMKEDQFYQATAEALAAYRKLHGGE